MWVELAAANNASWCDLVSRAHGVEGAFTDQLWASPRRTPNFYPDAVTMRPGVSPASLLSAVDATPGCSVKDSFADLALEVHGFRVIVDGRWVMRRSGVAPDHARHDLRWNLVKSVLELEQFAAAWAGPDDSWHPFRPVLLEAPGVSFVAGWHRDRVVAGGVLNTTGTVTGLSNVFGSQLDRHQVWAGLVAAAERVHPGRHIVGYEAEPDLSAAVAAGFTKIGPVKVWLR